MLTPVIVGSSLPPRVFVALALLIALLASWVAVIRLRGDPSPLSEAPADELPSWMLPTILVLGVGLRLYFAAHDSAGGR